MSSLITITSTPLPRQRPAHRAPAEAIDVLFDEAQRYAVVRQLLPHAKRCACPKCTAAAIAATPATPAAEVIR